MDNTEPKKPVERDVSTEELTKALNAFGTAIHPLENTAQSVGKISEELGKVVSRFEKLTEKVDESTEHTFNRLKLNIETISHSIHQTSEKTIQNLEQGVARLTNSAGFLAPAFTRAFEAIKSIPYVGWIAGIATSILVMGRMASDEVSVMSHRAVLGLRDTTANAERFVGQTGVAISHFNTKWMMGLEGAEKYVEKLHHTTHGKLKESSKDIIDVGDAIASMGMAIGKPPEEMFTFFDKVRSSADDTKEAIKGLIEPMRVSISIAKSSAFGFEEFNKTLMAGTEQYKLYGSEQGFILRNTVMLSEMTDKYMKSLGGIGRPAAQEMFKGIAGFESGMMKDPGMMVWLTGRENFKDTKGMMEAWELASNQFGGKENMGRLFAAFINKISQTTGDIYTGAFSFAQKTGTDVRTIMPMIREWNLFEPLLTGARTSPLIAKLMDTATPRESRKGIIEEIVGGLNVGQIEKDKIGNSLKELSESLAPKQASTVDLLRQIEILFKDFMRAAFPALSNIIVDLLALSKAGLYWLMVLPSKIATELTFRSSKPEVVQAENAIKTILENMKTEGSTIFGSAKPFFGKLLGANDPFYESLIKRWDNYNELLSPPVKFDEKADAEQRRKGWEAEARYHQEVRERNEALGRKITEFVSPIFGLNQISNLDSIIKDAYNQNQKPEQQAESGFSDNTLPFTHRFVSKTRRGLDKLELIVELDAFTLGSFIPGLHR
jgi:hypothetical protein